MILREFKRKAILARKRRKLQAKCDRVYDLYQKEIESAKSFEDKDELEQQQYFECSEYTDAIRELDSADITRRGTRCHLSLSDFPAPEGERPWVRGLHGASFIEPKIYREFAKAVEAAEHERLKRSLEQRDFWLKLFTGIFAALAAVASIINLVRQW